MTAKILIDTHPTGLGDGWGNWAKSQAQRGMAGWSTEWSPNRTDEQGPAVHVAWWPWWPWGRSGAKVK